GGGPVATALVTLSRLGADCVFFGIVGDDQEGAKIRKSLADEGINVRGLLTREKSASQTAFIAIEKTSGKRTIFWKRPSGKELAPDELTDGFLHGAGFLLLDGLMKKVSLHAALLAKQMHVPVMLDAGRLRDGMIDIAQLSDYVVASEEFARELGFDGDAEKFREVLRKDGLGLTTVTLGERGSITFIGNEIITVPAFDVQAVDTTGAGDVFHGGYIYGIMKGWDIAAAVRFASAVAALKCLKVGGRAGIPNLAQVCRFMEEKGRCHPDLKPGPVVD
ncbi:MAG TPA: PfkB family carbohydrate kinase, partial [Dissulfurispiraceae bacterium]|nr:PfkB family carbohydrate kinase [Dissulfurispiraceae bacterium]